MTDYAQGEKGFAYEQSTGALAIRNGEFDCPLYVGSAGREAGRNNPEAEHLRGIGPIPRGSYRMRVLAHPRFKAPAIRLDPLLATQARLEDLGRSGFWIHGGTHSEGCILVNGYTRNLIATAIGLGFDVLEVVR